MPRLHACLFETPVLLSSWAIKICPSCPARLGKSCVPMTNLSSHNRRHLTAQALSIFWMAQCSDNLWSGAICPLLLLWWLVFSTTAAVPSNDGSLNIKLRDAERNSSPVDGRKQASHITTITYSINYGNTVASQLFSQVIDYDKQNVINSSLISDWFRFCNRTFNQQWRWLWCLRAGTDSIECHEKSYCKGINPY